MALGHTEEAAELTKMCPQHQGAQAKAKMRTGLGSTQLLSGHHPASLG